jgi:2-polyprenyl-6-methoxyphenol hydroxylase-like FAD-dependent oxidoreductase
VTSHPAQVIIAGAGPIRLILAAELQLADVRHQPWQTALTFDASATRDFVRPSDPSHSNVQLDI